MREYCNEAGVWYLFEHAYTMSTYIKKNRVYIFIYHTRYHLPPRYYQVLPQVSHNMAKGLALMPGAVIWLGVHTYLVDDDWCYSVNSIMRVHKMIMLGWRNNSILYPKSNMDGWLG